MPIRSFLLLTTSLLIGWPVALLSAQPDSTRQQAGTAALFGSQTPITFTLMTRMTALVNDRTKPLADSLAGRHPATLTYLDSVQGASVSVPVAVMVRGNFRRNATNCAFPPLYLDFPKKKVKNTLFAGQNKLKLVTHCQGDDYVLREFLIYKLYNLLTPLSFRTRLARVAYVDSLEKRPTETRWGFLIEADDAVIRRSQLTEIGKGLPSTDIDSVSMVRLAVFEFMIGNIDWSVSYRHNIRLAKSGTDGKPLVIPYDFDHAGLVDAPYAQYADRSGEEGLPTRAYRGPLYPGWLLKRVFAEFVTLKPQFYALYQTEKRLTRGYITQSITYLDGFYQIIGDPNAVRANFFNGDANGKLFRSFN